MNHTLDNKGRIVTLKRMIVVSRKRTTNAQSNTLLYREDGTEENIESQSEMMYTTAFEVDDKVFINRFLRDQLKMDLKNESEEY